MKTTFKNQTPKVTHIQPSFAAWLKPKAVTFLPAEISTQQTKDLLCTIMSATTKILASLTPTLSAADTAAIQKFKSNGGPHACIVMGATGAVGKALVRDLMETDAFSKVTLLLRREVEYEGPHPEKLVQHKVDFENLDESLLKGHDTMFCTFGTTKKQAGSAEAFQKIDRDYVLNAAQKFKAANPSTPLHFLYTSSTGANPTSWFLYPRTKGEIENGLKSAGFDKCTIVRPGFLGTEESRKESRLAENSLTAGISSLFGMLTPVANVARAMRRAAIGGGDGIAQPTEAGPHTFEHKNIMAMGI
ncbi:hypothetical protein DFS34DRAFT_612018 [Phlyctochytrium arcticum]|nr:hypothetical protein DFS34DRAFT_612018 [Phlyctochytrium arcticum]